MKNFVALVALAFLAASVARGGEIHGTLTDNGKPVAAGTALKLDCGGTTASASTDEYGSYSLKTATTGDCQLTVAYKGGSASLKVTVYDKPSRYDLVVKDEAGKLTLARK